MFGVHCFRTIDAYEAESGEPATPSAHHWLERGISLDAKRDVDLDVLFSIVIRRLSTTVVFTLDYMYTDETFPAQIKPNSVGNLLTLGLCAAAAAAAALCVGFRGQE